MPLMSLRVAQRRALLELDGGAVKARLIMIT